MRVQIVAYLCIPLSPRLQVIENLATAVYGLTIKQLLDEPENQTGFALLYNILGDQPNVQRHFEY